MCVLFSRTEKCVTLSTTEAKYVALADTIKEVIFCGMCGIYFPGFGTSCITVFEDNERANHLAQSPVCTSNSKLLVVLRTLHDEPHVPAGHVILLKNLMSNSQIALGKTYG